MRMTGDYILIRTPTPHLYFLHCTTLSSGDSWLLNELRSAVSPQQAATTTTFDWLDDRRQKVFPIIIIVFKTLFGILGSSGFL